MACSKWDNMLAQAIHQQQQYYELLAEWKMYKKDEYMYLKQNIGFSLFGPPTNETESTSADNIVQAYSRNGPCSNTDVFRMVHYNSKAMEIINIIYDKICEFGKEYKHDNIYCGLIYNIIFTCKEDMPKKREDEENLTITAVPVFKIRKYTDHSYEIWYIDLNGRIYKNWMDYQKNNTLPRCTMVLPKKGYYQADLAHIITETKSTVWLEFLNSPACQIACTTLNVLDGASNVLSIFGVGLGVASLMTPAAPVVLTAGLVATSGVWTAMRSAGQLIDRKKHEESLTDRNAFGAWLGLASSAVGLGATKGASLISKAVVRGQVVSKATRITYNVLVASGIVLSTAGIGCQGYALYSKYREKNKVDALDAVMLGCHILFLSNYVINVKFATSLIESSQGAILKDYESNLRTKRLRRSYNKAKRNAAANNTNTIDEKAEIIQYITKKSDLLSKAGSHKPFASKASALSKGQLQVQGITLIDPQVYESESTLTSEATVSASDASDANNDVLLELSSLLKSLLTDFYSSQGEPSTNVLLIINELTCLLLELKHVENAKTVLRTLFKIVETVVNNYDSLKHCVAETARFIWGYVKKTYDSAKRTCASASVTSSLLETSITAILSVLQDIMEPMLSAIRMHLYHRYNICI